MYWFQNRHIKIHIKRKKLDEKDDILYCFFIGNGKEVNFMKTWSNISDYLGLAP